jgi:hypothetical protein
MSRAHHRQGSGRDRLKELREFESEKDSHIVLRELQNKKINTQTAIRRLELNGAYGLFSCGELLIQEAYDMPVGGDHLNSLLNASEYLKLAIRSRNIANSGRVDSLTARAGIQLANIPIHDLVIQGKFPEQNLAKVVHQNTLEIAHNLMTDSRHQYDNDRTYSVGALGEFSLLSLDQRLGLKIGSEIYLTCPSTFKQDYRNTHGSVIDRGVDMNILGDVGSGMSLISQVQVKTKNTKSDGTQIRPVGEGISLVCIDTDLRFENEYGFIPAKIIEDLIIERDYPSNSNEHIQASERLDARTELFLTALGID